ncbi:MAG: GTPase, partial [Burkholderiaceae bacterium]|nr:GTPase [Burkholderiaceae bacterium]
GASAATLVGRSVVSGLLKFIPGAGSAIGGTIAATTAGAITKLLGNAYIAVLYDFCQKHPGQDLDIPMITQALKQRMKP